MGVEYDELLDLIPQDEILDYLNGTPKRGIGDTQPADLPSWDELKVIYGREGREAVVELIARAFHDATGVEML